MNIWRSWFSLGNLNGLTAIMVAHRSEKRIKVVAKDRFQAQETTGKLQEFYNVAFSLGDDVSASIAGSYLFDPTTESAKELAKLEMMAQAEGLELGFPAVLAHLHILARSFNKSPDEFVEFSRGVLEQTMRSNRRDHIESICQVVARTFDQSSRRQFGDIERGPRFHHFLDPNLAVKLAVRDPRSTRLLIGVFKRLHDHEWIFDFNRRLLDFFSHDSPPFGSSPFGAGVPELNSGDYAEWLLLFREIGGPGGLFQHVDLRPMSPKRFFGVPRQSG